MALFRKEVRESPDDVFDATLRASLANTVITVETVCEIPAVASAVSFIAGTIAGLPIRLYKDENGKSDEIADDYRLNLLNCETGDVLDAFQWKSTLVRDYLLAGNGYTYVNWKGSEIEGLYYVDPRYISYQKNADPVFKKVKFAVNGKNYRDFQIFRVLKNTKDGVSGSGIVAESPKHLDTMFNAILYEGHMLKTGSKKGFLKAQKRLTQEVIDSLKKAWRNLYGNNSEETVVVLNDGLEFQDASTTALDTQLNENKKTNSDEVYRMFGIVPSVINGDGTENDYKNTIKFAIIPVVKALESAINRFCLLESEKGIYRFEFDLDSLDNTDLLTRFQAYEVATRNGWMTLDEIRFDEGKNPLGLNFIRLGLDTVIYDPVKKQTYTANTGQWADFGTGQTSVKGGVEQVED